MENKENQKFTFTSLRYKLEGSIGEGTYGKVYKGIKDNKEYAIKRVYAQSEGLQLTTIREIKFLRSTHHRNIIELLEINVEKEDLFLVFPYFKFDLTKYLAKNILNKREMIHIMKQLLDGIQYLHSQNITHRDIKPGNILMDFNLNVKIADFGMARNCNSTHVYSPGVVTLWYRAPEVLLNSDKYDSLIDIWSLGCVFAEMLLGHPLFQGNSEIKMLESIVYVCGSINEKTYPNVGDFSNFKALSLPRSTRNLNRILKNFYPDVVSLIDTMLNVYPKKRPSLEQILSNEMFKDYKPNFINDIAESYKKKH